MTQPNSLRRHRTLVATAAIALVATAPAAQAMAENPAAKGDPNAHSAKSMSPTERTSALSAARKDTAKMADRIGLAATQSLRVKDVRVDVNGAKHQRYDRTYRGLPVLGGDLVVHSTKAGKVSQVDRASEGNVSVPSIKPAVAKAKAISSATKAAPYRVRKKGATLSVLAGAKDRLVWDTVVEGVKKDQTPSRLHVIVDAVTGKTIKSYDEIHTGSGDSIYSGTVEIGTSGSAGAFEMVDTGRGNGTTYDLGNAESGGDVFTDDDDQWGDGTAADPQSAGVDAHYGAGLTWDYFLNRHQRTGIFDDGKGVPSRVHYGDNYVNAFWDGQQMTYGDGEGNANPLTELDVAGHEMSHGVTEATAGLEYSGDAGGLNESTSDIFGTAVEFSANNTEDVGDYLIGEEIDINGDGTPLRYMDKPSKDGASYDCWDDSVGNDDPHYSSGPGNHFFYLASEGSGAKEINGVSYDSPTCDGAAVEGIGREKVEDVWYRALSTYFTSTTSYPEARDATVKAAVDLYGAGSAECAGIEAAWTGIAVPAGSETCG